MHEPDGEGRALVNPEIIESSGREEGEEGCLSLPQVYTGVPRATRIRVRAQESDGTMVEFEARDFEARVIQHELDHLNGIIFLDRVDILTRQAKLAEWDDVRARLVTADED
jgi:peptide deformylase